MERYIELHEGKSRSQELDMKIEWIEMALDMRDYGDPNAPNLDTIDLYTNILDAEHVQIQRCCENKCRNKKNGKFPFFPDMNQWWHKRQVYNRLLKYLRGNGGKIKGLRKECERHEIPQSCDMAIEQAFEVEGIV